MDDPIDFHAASTVLDQHPEVRYPLVVGFFVSCAIFQYQSRIRSKMADAGRPAP